MPLFFMLAGYLFKQERTFSELIHKIAHRYIIPYFILCGINLLIEIIIHFILGMEYDVPNYVRGIIYSRGTFECMPNCTPLWFLTALSSALVIYFWITRIKSRILYFFAVVLCPVVSFLLAKYGCPKLFWNIDSALMGIIFIAFGHMIRTSDLLGKFENLSLTKQISLLVIMFCVGTAGIMFNFNFGDGSVSFDNNHYGSLILMIIGATGVSLVVFCVVRKIFADRSGFLGYLGQHTVFIMSFDFFANRIASHSLDFLGMHNVFTALTLKLAIIITGLMLWNMLIKRIHNENIRELMTF